MGFGFGFDLLAGLAAGSPDIPRFNPVDLGESQTKAIESNQASLPAAETLASGVNQFNQEQLQKLLQQSIPGYNAIKSKVSGNIMSQLSGEIPQDVQDAVQLNAAAKAIGGGFAGSGMHSDLVARDLGLTSLSLTERGLASAESWLQTVNNLENRAVFDVSSMFITPQQQFAASTSERDKAFQHDYVSNMNDWQHSTGFLIGQDVTNTGNTIGNLLSSYLGGMAGKK